MRPPQCRICDKEEGCDLVYFAKRESDLAWEKHMKENEMIGHPPWVDWFCEDHVASARELAGLPITDAVKKMKE